MVQRSSKIQHPLNGGFIFDYKTIAYKIELIYNALVAFSCDNFKEPIMSMAKVTVTYRIDVETYEWLKEKAVKEDRSVNAQVNRILAQARQADGHADQAATRK